MSRGAAPRIFERGYYQRLREIEETHGWSRGLRRAMDRLLDEPLAGRTALRALDVGCGTGLLLDHLERWPLAGEAVGIDVSPHALAYCTARGRRRVVEASAVHLPWASGRFDLVVCIDTLQHLSPQGADRAAVAEMARVLAPGGVLYLRTNAAWGHRPVTGARPDLYRRYRLREVEEMIDGAGLEPLRSTHLNALPSLPAAVRERLLRPRPTAPEGPALTIRPRARSLAWLDHLLAAVLSAEAWLVGRGLDLPFGHSTAFVARKPDDRFEQGAR